MKKIRDSRKKFFFSSYLFLVWISILFILFLSVFIRPIITGNVLFEDNIDVGHGLDKIDFIVFIGVAVILFIAIAGVLSKYIFQTFYKR